MESLPPHSEHHLETTAPNLFFKASNRPLVGKPNLANSALIVLLSIASISSLENNIDAFNDLI